MLHTKIKRLIKYLFFTKTTMKWPMECCDDGASMANNNFLFPDHCTCIMYFLYLILGSLLPGSWFSFPHPTFTFSTQPFRACIFMFANQAMTNWKSMIMQVVSQILRDYYMLHVHVHFLYLPYRPWYREVIVGGLIPGTIWKIVCHNLSTCITYVFYINFFQALTFIL